MKRVTPPQFACAGIPEKNIKNRVYLAQVYIAETIYQKYEDNVLLNYSVIIP
jgi:hypothetical protein